MAMSLTRFLPYVLTLTGLGLASNIDNPLSYNSGFVLLLLACLIWIRRLDHREPAKPMKELPQEEEQGGHEAAPKLRQAIR
jgi:hypothetical protein